MLRVPPPAARRLQALQRSLEGSRRLLILTHDNPDPDAIASGWALMRVVRKLRSIHVDLAHGGIIGRGENRALREVLRVPLKAIESLDLESYQAVALVDCQPETGNNSLPAGLIPRIVIDHHPLRRQTREVAFFDVREAYGATASILSEYLQASGVKIDRPLATALFYAVKAETQNLGRGASKADLRPFLELFPLVDNVALSLIEHPPVPREYFSMFGRAINGTRLHGPVAITRLGAVSSPDVVAEFADRIVRLEGAHWALSMGRFGRDILVSIRTDLNRANAGRMIQRVVGSEGTAGGHGMMAGGKIEGGAETEEEARRIERLMEMRALRILKADPEGESLVDGPASRTAGPVLGSEVARSRAPDATHRGGDTGDRDKEER